MEAGKASISLLKEIPAVLSIANRISVLSALAMLVLSNKKQEIMEEYDHVKR